MEKELAIPLFENEIWNTLSFTREYKRGQSGWTGKFRVSLNVISEEDGYFLEKMLLKQKDERKIYKISEQEEKYLASHQIKTQTKSITVTIPEKENDEIDKEEIRESVKIQAALAEIGSKMGYKIWVPRNNKVNVTSNSKIKQDSFLGILPLNYDQTTLKTIEQIDVLWIKGRSIVRAFEVEHTTSVYSGILRMADLLALQPNMSIKLHIVAPQERREKVFSEIKRPVFSVLEKGPLSENCTFISYDSVNELSGEKHLEHLSDSVLDEYEEVAE